MESILNDIDGSPSTVEKPPPSRIKTVLRVVLGISLLAAAALGGYFYSENRKTNARLDAIQNDISTINEMLVKINKNASYADNASGIADLSSKVDDLTRKIGDLEEDLQKIKRGISEIESDVSSIQTKIGY